ncbi:MAG TPA: NAD(P)-dependent alcohol dehydrogenase [Candidatus Choladousia intestinipullorum]|nr:NAD(P)-dependent alcohol dehydrogenase [Candidatus Choladousia intestinipullorum]
MKVAYMKEKMHIEVRDDAQIPEPKEGEVLVKIEACGICGSDVHFYKDGRVGDVMAPEDFVLGHEVAGVVTKVGEGVKDLKEGDRVALEPGYPCGKCEYCMSGRYNLCPDVVFFADPPVEGALKEYVAHPAQMCFKLPENMTTEEGALIEPLAVGLHATGLGNVGLGDEVLILGGGCIGLVTLLSAKARGASKIVVVDLYEKRLNMAKQLGATDVIQAGTENVEERIGELFNGKGADIVFETAGAIPTIQQTPYFVKKGGTIVLVGMAAESMAEYNFSQAMKKEITIKTVFRYRNLYPTAIAAVSSGSIDVKQIVTHRFTFDESDKAFRTVVEDAKNVIKGVIQF